MKVYFSGNFPVILNDKPMIVGWRADCDKSIFNPKILTHWWDKTSRLSNWGYESQEYYGSTPEQLAAAEAVATGDVRIDDFNHKAWWTAKNNAEENASPQAALIIGLGSQDKVLSALKDSDSEVVTEVLEIFNPENSKFSEVRRLTDDYSKPESLEFYKRELQSQSTTLKQRP